MMSSRHEIALNATTGALDERTGSGCRLHRLFFKAALAGLCGVGGLVILCSGWLAWSQATARGGQQDGLPVEAGLLQPLVTGNLAICLLWVGLDLTALRRYPQEVEARGNLTLVALFAACVNTVSALVAAGAHGGGDVGALALLISLPLLAVVTPLLWSAARRLKSSRFRALVLIGFVAASAFAQERVGSPATPDAAVSFFVVNSYLIGLALAVWLLAWTTGPNAGRTA